MPNPMKIQPVNSISDLETLPEPNRGDPVKPVFKSLLRRLFDRQFPSVLKNSSTAETQQQQWSATKDAAVAEFEPSSLCLEKMVQNFIEENYEKHITGRKRCNCFNGNSNDSSDDESELSLGFQDTVSVSTSADFLKSLICCGSVGEKNLLADASRIVEKNKVMKRKDDLRTIVAEGLAAAGYDASICKSRWEKSAGYPAGEYEYIDVFVEGERVIIDIDFRSEFEIARSTGSYKAILQLVPYIFVGKGDRLQQIVSIVCEAARQSLKKKGMPFPPWRKAEYMRSKWLAPNTRAKQQQPPPVENAGKSDDDDGSEHGELELIFGHEGSECGAVADTGEVEVIMKASESEGGAGEVEVIMKASESEGGAGEVEVIMKAWHPPPVKPKRSGKGGVTGLAFLLRDKPLQF